MDPFITNSDVGLEYATLGTNSIPEPSAAALTLFSNPLRPLGKFWGNSGEIAARQCRCTFRQIENYRQRISGPLLDRIDLHVEVPPVTFRELSSD